MFPYQIYQVLADEHLHDLRAAARRAELIAQAKMARRDQTDRSSRLKNGVSQLVALVHGPAQPASRGARATSKTASSPAGPMGCVA